MARVTEGILGDVQLGLTLDRYQEILHLPINAFNGLNKPDETPVYECSTIWKQSQRDDLAQFLYDAEEQREEELGFFLTPKWKEQERHEYTSPVILEHKHFIEVGRKTTSTIETGVSLTHRSGGVIQDPVEFTVSTTVTDSSEIKVFYPGEDVEITPKSISISGGVATIKVQRARLVKPNLLDNRDDHLMYDDDDNFLETVDVKRVYADPTNAVLLTWTTTQLALLGEQTYPSGSEQTQTAVASLHGERAERLSIIELWPAEYSSGTWTGKKLDEVIRPDRVDIWYRSGIQNSKANELLTIRLAHTKMPNTPCSCPYVEQYWMGDREPSDMWTPYGNKMGAVEAWMADQRRKVGMGGTLP